MKQRLIPREPTGVNQRLGTAQEPRKGPAEGGPNSDERMTHTHANRFCPMQAGSLREAPLRVAKSTCAQPASSQGWSPVSSSARVCSLNDVSTAPVSRRRAMLMGRSRSESAQDRLVSHTPTSPPVQPHMEVCSPSPAMKATHPGQKPCFTRNLWLSCIS
jgi:hypothetical protein